jgi:hypothetical protein
VSVSEKDVGRGTVSELEIGLFLAGLLMRVEVFVENPATATLRPCQAGLGCIHGAELVDLALPGARPRGPAINITRPIRSNVFVSISSLLMVSYPVHGSR